MATSNLKFSHIKLFVGGPIQYGLREDSIFDPALKTLISSLLRELKRIGFEVLSAHQVENFGEVDVSGQTDAIVRRDYEWMLSCDAYVCILPEASDAQPYRSDGTCIELGWASALNKPILILFSSTATYSHLFTGLGTITNASYLAMEQILQDPSLIEDTLYLLLEPGGTVDAIDRRATMSANAASSNRGNSHSS